MGFGGKVSCVSNKSVEVNNILINQHASDTASI